MTRRILCIEDEPGLAADITDELTDAGYAVDLATDGAAGLAALGDKTYDLVLCDVQVPVRSGLEVLAAAIAVVPPSLPAPPFVMMTAYADPNLKASCARLGVRHLLVKPVDYSDLLRLISAEFGE